MNELLGDPPQTTDKFWEAFQAVYPRREHWVDAKKAWKQLAPDPALAVKIVADVALRKENNWAGREKWLIPLPATYIRGNQWEDEIYRRGNGTTKQLDGDKHGKFSKFVRGSGPAKGE